MKYIIQRGQKFYHWSDTRNDVVWDSNRITATVWTNRKTAEQVARANGGSVIQEKASA